ncbi:sugar phosphate isomerase/epimerase family protein [Pseudomonas fluorescens]|uniref:sugar phosphate isomerase/epimerase family protein n=1 Tax=Pseudomonas fluorescens TaxID=294 RepID=UPI001912DC39|nr:sugar phosphate isomerase/epimerase family protein [Pseudomonas fluorescens]
MNHDQRSYGGSTFSWMWQSSALDAMRSLAALELNDFDVLVLPGHLWHLELDQGARSQLAKTLRVDGLRIESLNIPALDHNLASCVPEVRAYSIALFSRVMELSSDLGGRGVVAVPGRVSSLFPPPQADSQALLADSFEQLLKVAERLQQVIFMESHPQTPLPTYDLIESFMKRVDHPLLRVAYDVSNAEFVGEDQVSAIHQLAPWLGQVHLSDGTRDRWRHDRVGEGTVRFDAIEAVLDEIEFKGVRVLEIISNTPVPDIAASKAALATRLKSTEQQR